ncbi:ABC transporter permease [Intrasporangium sp. DVR]|uniref:ABC transporter permease n=1 Tax=Intrasporangium sp. DVR TaxID=3127867 RepID=UPI00313A5A8C
MKQLWTMTQYDLRQRIRDRSVVIFAIIVPLALMFVLDLVLGDLADPELRPTKVAAAAPADDALAVALLDVVRSLDGVEGLDLTVRTAAADEVHGLTRDDAVQVGLIVPEGFGAALQQGRPIEVTIVSGGGTGIEQSIVTSVVESAVERFSAGALAAAAGADAGLDPADLAAIGQEVARGQPTITLTEGVASDEQLSSTGALVAGQAGLFLLFTVGFGVTSLVTEREQGTLARLRSMPMPAWTIVTAKALVSFILGVVATTILLTVGGRLFGVSFGAPIAVAVLILAAVLAATSLMFVIARVARTAEQSNIAQSIIALVLGIAGGAFFQITARGWLGSVMDLNPVSALIRGLGITSGGGGLGDIGIPLLTMLGFAAVVLVVSRLVPDRGAVQ